MNENKIKEKLVQKDVKIQNPKYSLKQEISFLIATYKNKLSEYKIAKENISESKTIFRNLLSELETKKNSIKIKEKEIETYLLKITKLHKNLIISINKTINNKFYTHLIEIIGDKQKEKSLIQFFDFVFNIYNISRHYISQQLDSNIDKDFINIFLEKEENKNMKNILRILKDETEIRNLILYLLEVIRNLNKEEKDIYNKIKELYLNIYHSINQEEKQYPIDCLYDYFNTIFQIVDCENQVENEKIILNNFIKDKNTKFVQIKNLETLIKKYNANKKIISNDIEAMNLFLLKIKKILENSNNLNISEFMKLIEDIKTIISKGDKLDKNIDYMNSLSIKTNATCNEKSSLKNSILEIKVDIKDFDCIIDNSENLENNKNPKGDKTNKSYKINNEIFSKTNHTYEKINKTYSIYKNDNKNRNKNNIKSKLLGKEREVKCFNYKTMNNNLSLIKKSLHNSTTNDIKYKTNQKKQLIEKSFNKIKKTKILNKNRGNRNENRLIPKQKSQIINKIRSSKLNSNSINRSKIIKTLNNIIHSDNIKESYIEKNTNNKYNTSNLTYNCSVNKEKILPKKNNHNRILLQKKEKLFNYHEKTKQIKLITKKSLLNSNSVNLGNKIQNNDNKGKLREIIKEKERDNSFEITMPNKENVHNEENDDVIDIRDSICDEIGSKNYDNEKGLIRSNTNNYINKLGMRKNIIWTENLYNNKITKYKTNNKQLNVEKPIDTFACCASCT